MVEIDIQTKLNFSRTILHFEGKSKAHQKGTIISGLTNILAFNYLIRRETPQIEHVSIKVTEHKDYLQDDVMPSS